MRVIFPSSCRYLLPNTPAGALQQIWPNQFWLRRFSWFSGFPPLFWHRLPCFREGDACVGRQPPDTGGNFLRLGKNAAFNVGFAQFEPESFFSPPIWSSQKKNMIPCYQLNAVRLLDGFIGSWRSVVFSCLPFFGGGFFLHCGFCRRGGQMRTRATPPRPHPQARSTLQRWNPHKIDKNSSFYILGLIVRSCAGKIRTQVSLLKLFIAALYITETHIKEIRRVGKKGCWPRVVIKWKNKR